VKPCCGFAVLFASILLTATCAGAEEHWALLNDYCVECHNFEDWAGGVAFDTMRPEAIPEDAKIWEAVVRKLRGRMMPPPGQDRPGESHIDAMVSWLERTLDQAAATKPNPGHVALHRLNRTEYENAVEDLLELHVDATALLPEDDISAGFDNVANVLQVSPSFLQQSLSAARNLSVQAVGNPAPRPVGVPYVVSGSGNQRFHVEGLPLGTRGGALVEHDFPADGEYELNIADMAQGLWEYGSEFEHTLIAVLDGVKFFETKLGGGEDLKAMDQKQAPAWEAINARLKHIRFRATAGPHKVGVTFLHRSFAESDDYLYSLVPGGGQDRLLRVSSFEIRGPFNPTGLSETPSRRRIFTCYPQAASEEAGCAHQIVSSLATRAFRRPLTQADLDELLPFYERGHEQGGFETGIQHALAAILAHPKFLYRIEKLPADRVPGSIHRLSDVELASRLAFFLWSSVPDQELLDVGQSGRLHEPKVLERQVRRMLADPKSETLASDFCFQWLDVRSLKDVEPDPVLFADVDRDLRALFAEEIRLFTDSILREDRSVLDLLNADYTFVNERLALHYGIEGVKGDRFRRVRLEDSYRFGLLGKGGVLLVSSYPNRTAPVLRGQWILQNLLGTPPTPPPPGVEALKENVEGQKALTVRERMIAHRKDPSCNHCHGVLDPLGLALENFDAVGRWQTRDRFAGTPIDATGELPDGTVLEGPDDLRAALLKRPDQFVQTLTEKLMTFALGRAVEYSDMPAVRAIVRAAAEDEYRFSSVLLGIVNSAQFQTFAVPEAESAQLALVCGSGFGRECDAEAVRE
jgi:hypothetical protein